MAKSSQEQLLVDEPPRYKDATVSVDAIKDGAWGPAPDPGLVRSIRHLGVTVPVLLIEEDGGYRIVDGRRRVQAAREAGSMDIPARIIVSGDPDLVDPAVGLASNGARSPNPIVELNSIESLIAERKASETDIARATGMPLKVVRKRIRLANLAAELRQGWLEGRFANPVGESAAKLNADKQRELTKRLEANGMLTMADVADVKRTGVRRHQRRLPDATWPDKVREALSKALSVAEEQDEDSDLVVAIREALELVPETAESTEEPGE